MCRPTEEPLMDTINSRYGTLDTLGLEEQALRRARLRDKADEYRAQGGQLVHQRSRF